MEIVLKFCYSNPIMQNTHPPVNKTNKIEQTEKVFAKLMADASQRGFYGTAGVTLSVQDGFIQHIRVTTERMIK